MGAVSDGDVSDSGIGGVGGAGGPGLELGCGYLKSYWYDSRMKYEMPPYFLQPTNSGWGAYDWSMPSANNPINLNINPSQWLPAQSIKVSTTSYTATSGQALQMTAAVYADLAQTNENTPQSVTWSLSESDPSHPTGSTIDTNTGLLTAGANAGSVTVTATANGFLPKVLQVSPAITISSSSP
jgi:hypothetical protein